MGKKIVTVNGRRDSNFPCVWIVLNAYNFAFTGNLDSGGSGEFWREGHRELDLRVLLNFTIDVEKDPTRAHIASLCMHRSV